MRLGFDYKFRPKETAVAVKDFPKIIEEFEDNQPTDIEADQGPEPRQIISPYDPTLIRVDPKVYSIRQVLDMIEDGELDLAPDFQRKKVWKAQQKSLLIESLLLRIPLPAFYFSSDNEGRLQVVDGVQRLTTIKEFVDGKLELQELEYLNDELGESTFGDLDGSVWGRRILTTQISANVIDPQTPSAVKFDIFRRINTGGSPLNSQEIRHCMSKPRSRNLLKKLCSLDSFKSAVGPAMVDQNRMVDRELALRFCSFRLIGDIAHFKKYESLDEFLTVLNERLDNPKDISDAELNELIVSFDVAMTNAIELFGSHAFRKWPNYEAKLSPINRALFDVWSVVLSRLTIDQVRRTKESLVADAREEMTEDWEFIQSISNSTSSPSRIITRFDRVNSLVRNALNAHKA